LSGDKAAAVSNKHDCINKLHAHYSASIGSLEGELAVKEHQFEYGVVLRSLYNASIGLTVFVLLLFPSYAGYYILTLLVLGFGLRPLLEKTGLYHYFSHGAQRLDLHLHRKQLDQHRANIDRKVRDDKYRKSRSRDKDPRLPKNW